MVEEGVCRSLQSSAWRCRAKWRRPIRSAWVIRAPSEDCTLTFRREDAGVWGVDAAAGRDLGLEGKAGPRLLLAGECGQGLPLPHCGWEAAAARAGAVDWG